MKILVLNPYAGGSHRAFVDGWRAHSEHQLIVRELPGRHWKWRMRHAAWTLAQQVGDIDADAVWATDMIDLAAWRGLAPPAIARLPHVLYMHETQLPYPDPHRGERDLHYAFTNLFSAAAADAVWWNSGFHRDAFAAETRRLLARMPDCAPVDALDRVLGRSHVLYPGHDIAGDRPPRPVDAPPRILWAARWEQDKGPEDLFVAARQLAASGQRFTLDVIGQSGEREPPLFRDARQQLAGHIGRWGYLASRDDYRAALLEADIVVSTAHHEFFGIAVVEAVAAGAFPLLPRRQAYPEVFADFGDDAFYDGDLAGHLSQLCARVESDQLWGDDADRGRRAVARYHWRRCAAALDETVAGYSP